MNLHLFDKVTRRRLKSQNPVRSQKGTVSTTDLLALVTGEPSILLPRQTQKNNYNYKDSKINCDQAWEKWAYVHIKFDLVFTI